MSKDSYGLQIASGTITSGNEMKSSISKPILYQNNQSLKENSPSLL